MQLNSYNSESGQISAISNKFVSLVLNLLANQDTVTLAVSGGKSPRKLFDELSKLNIPWERIIVTLVDERIVPPTDQESNELMVKTHLLQHNAARARFIGLVDMNLPIDVMLDRINQKINNIDIAFLGMGDDGHIASIFTASPEFQSAIDLHNPKHYININPQTATYSRVSLTLKALIQIPVILLNISGENKYQVLIKASNQINDYPISYLLHERTDLEVFWFK